jgi:hypothetical protein
MTAPAHRDSILIWQKSSASADGGNCVEVARSKACVLVRDSGARSGPILAFSLARWHLFVRLIKEGKITPS